MLFLINFYVLFFLNAKNRKRIMLISRGNSENLRFHRNIRGTTDRVTIILKNYNISAFISPRTKVSQFLKYCKYTLNPTFFRNSYEFLINAAPFMSERPRDSWTSLVNNLSHYYQSIESTRQFRNDLTFLATKHPILFYTAEVLIKTHHSYVFFAFIKILKTLIIFKCHLGPHVAETRVSALKKLINK